MADLHDFDIRRAGPRWSIDEAMRAYRAMNENPDARCRMEFVDGRFYHSDAQRITMLGWMLEMMGADVAVRLGDPEVWCAAVASLDNDGWRELLWAEDVMAADSRHRVGAMACGATVDRRYPFTPVRVMPLMICR